MCFEQKTKQTLIQENKQNTHTHKFKQNEQQEKRDDGAPGHSQQAWQITKIKS